MTLMERLVGAGYPMEEMDHHCSDLYVYVTPLTRKVIDDGILAACPKRISADCRKKYDDCGDLLCPDCRQEFWMQEVE